MRLKIRLYIQLAHSIIFALCTFLCIGQNESKGATLIMLGTVQDAGSPHIGCRKKCCSHLWNNPDPKRKIVSLGIYDDETNSRVLIDATPDITSQLKRLAQVSRGFNSDIPEYIFITHAHIGHYTGLMYLGREGMNTKNIPLYVMPKMFEFLSTSGPWDQLVKINNVALNTLEANRPVKISSGLTITPFLVPHRGEYSETIGLLIAGKSKKALFIPDIDKWHLWEKNIIEEIAKVDYAFLDATFFDQSEVNNRNIAEIPHPFVVESIELFKNLPAEEKKKIYFLHFNHSNPLLDTKSTHTKEIKLKGYNISRYGDTFRL